MLTSVIMSLLMMTPGPALPPRPVALAMPVQPLTVAGDLTDKDGFAVDRITWTDAFAQRRSATLVHNDVQDPAGFWGGYLRTYTLMTPTGPRTCTGGSADHPGFGYTVNHYNGGVNSSRRYKGDSWRYLLRGKHHVILEQSWQYPVGNGNVRATVQWFFATGRSHPLYAVTFDSSGAGPNTLNADTRAPYGDIGWDGDAGLPVDGVAWGDRYKFHTLKGPVSPATGFDYTQPNTVPYTLAFSNQADGEMGLVQTQTEDQHDAGGYDGYKLWNTRNRQGPMPDPASWPFQINQWEYDYTNTSKRMAWGMNYGAVGQTAYSALGNDRTLSGYPFQSYSTFVVVGVHSRNEVRDQVRDVETLQGSTLTVSGAGHINTRGPGGVGRADGVEWDHVGFNPIYGTFEASYTGHGEPLNLHFAVAGERALGGTVLVVHDWTGKEPIVAIDGKRCGANTLAFASVDEESHTLWLSLVDPLAPGETTVTVTPDPESGQEGEG